METVHIFEEVEQVLHGGVEGTLRKLVEYLLLTLDRRRVESTFKDPVDQVRIEKKKEVTLSLKGVVMSEVIKSEF